MNTEQMTEFDKIKEMWADFAVTEAAREEIRKTTVCFDESELKRLQRDTTYSRNMIDRLGQPPLQSVTEILEILDLAEKGKCLTPYQLERVQKVIVIIERLKSYLARGKQYENPMAYYDENLTVDRVLEDEINIKIRVDDVDDHATKELYDIRMQKMRCSDKMKEKAEQIIRTHKDYMADSFYTTRNGRICVPVKKDCRLKVSGSVIDKSATGSTYFIEPAEVASYFEELQLLIVEEENEVCRILYTLSAMVAEAAPGMRENMKLMEMLDFKFSKGRLSIELDACEPSINTDRRIVLKDARHPLMNKGKNVPLQFKLGGDVRGIVITGPNTGGKTVAIKTVMLNSIMAQCGLHVTCGAADICMNSGYFCDIGDGQNLSENLSTFSAHIKNVLEILKSIDSDSFVIMDEMGSGTDPAEGMGIAVAILEKLRQSGANFLVTTHYPEVKDYAERAEHIINARMTFDRASLLPTYHMVIGEAGESCAFYIAERLGMPEDMLKTAERAAYGTKWKTDRYDGDAQRTVADDEISGTALNMKQSKRQERTGTAEKAKKACNERKVTSGESAGTAETPKEVCNERKVTSGESAGTAETPGAGTAELTSDRKPATGKIKKSAPVKQVSKVMREYNVGDSVYVLPDGKIGIVCEPVNEKGVLRVQVAGRKIWLNHKRVRLHVKAEELYPDDYDMSIVFDSVENRKIRHDMSRKYTDAVITEEK